MTSPFRRSSIRARSAEVSGLVWPFASGQVMKVKASVKRICNQCQIIRRRGKVRVICKADPKHKQVQG